MTVLLCGIILFTITQCKDDSPHNTNTDYSNISNTYGYGILTKIKGIWDGPVTSTTALGSYPQWIVDFRPISENQISSKNELDTLNDIQMSFFIAKYNNEYRVCFRNGGSFNGNSRISYFLADSVYETNNNSYYRFSEIIKGKKRAYTELIFKDDSLTMNSYTNIYNTLTNPTLHSSWKAVLKDNTTCAAAISHFNFPQKTLTKDFTSVFGTAAEAIFYNTTSGDPYTDAQQPYLGQATITYSYNASYTPNASKNVFLMISTQPLISGFSMNLANLKFRSRYVILNSTNLNYTFKLMHPGTYYLYAMYDNDGNNMFSSGDWVSTTNTSFTLLEKGVVAATTQINFTLP